MPCNAIVSRKKTKPIEVCIRKFYRGIVHTSKFRDSCEQETVRAL